MAKIVEHLQTAVPLLTDPSAKVRAIVAARPRSRGRAARRGRCVGSLYRRPAAGQTPNPQGERAKPAALRDLHLAMGDALLVGRVAGQSRRRLSPGRATRRNADSRRRSGSQNRGLSRKSRPAGRRQKLGRCPTVVVREWIDEFPADQVRGDVALLAGQNRTRFAASRWPSLRPLQLAVALDRGLRRRSRSPLAVGRNVSTIGRRRKTTASARSPRRGRPDRSLPRKGLNHLGQK